MNIKLAGFLAWRSLGRNRKRTWVSIIAISVGMALCMLMLGFGDGFYQRTIDSAVRQSAGNIVLQHPYYQTKPAIDLTVHVPKGDIHKITRVAEVASVQPFVIANVLVRSGYSARNGSLFGVDVKAGASSDIAQKIVQGRYLKAQNSQAPSQEIIISDKLAKILRVDLNKRLVLVASDAQGNMIEALFRVIGIFTANADGIDSYIIHIPITAAQTMFNMPADQVTRLGILLDDANQQTKVLQTLAVLNQPERQVLPWQEVLPSLADYIQTDRFGLMVFNGMFIFLALATIFNTLLMSVLERRHEFSTIMALGTPPALLRVQVLLEGVILAAVGTNIGTLLGFVLLSPLYIYGVDMSVLFPEGMSTAGVSMSTHIYAYISFDTLVSLYLTVAFTTSLMALWPMYKATRVKLTQEHSV